MIAMPTDVRMTSKQNGSAVIVVVAIAYTILLTLQLQSFST